jgi:predicted AAA+ superfamily ATPase
LSKRLVKTPKVYWRDTGLLHSLLNVGNPRLLLDQPWVGASWEGFVIEQVISTLSLTRKPFVPYFLRTSDQYEIDLVLDFGGELWAVEVKIVGSPTVADMDRLNRAADLIKARKRIFICRGREQLSNGNVCSCNLRQFLEMLQKQ